MKRSYKKAVFIINPASGQGDSKKRKSEIVTIAKSLGWDGKALTTTRKNHAGVLAEKAILDGARHIVVCGGDGTIMEALQEVMNSKVVIGIVPLGTGNLFAQNLQLPIALDEAINTALLGKPLKIDIGKANNTFFAIIAGLGFDADIMKETKRELKRRYGFLAYLFSSIKAFKKKSGLYEIIVDDNPPERIKAKIVLVANMGKLQAGIEAVPRAHHQSGLLHLALIQAATFRHILSVLGNALLGRVHHSPHYILKEGKKIKITSLHGPKPYECDGNHFPSTSTLDVEIFPKSVSVLVTP